MSVLIIRKERTRRRLDDVRDATAEEGKNREMRSPLDSTAAGNKVTIRHQVMTIPARPDACTVSVHVAPTRSGSVVSLRRCDGQVEVGLSPQEQPRWSRMSVWPGHRCRET